jgi:hypothetical protein
MMGTSEIDERRRSLMVLGEGKIRDAAWHGERPLHNELIAGHFLKKL